MSLISKLLLKIMETGMVPEKVVRCYVNRMLSQAVDRAALGDIEARHAVFRQILKDLKASCGLRRRTVAEEQIAEMDPDFYHSFLGRRLSASSGFFPTGAETLDEAEETMLWMSADRARIRDGMKILELGSGLGAMTFWLARQFPASSITTVTNSVKSGIYLQKKLKEKNLKNVRVMTCDFDELELTETFDVIISLDRFDLVAAMPAWEKQIADWLKASGRFFFQFPVHSQLAYYNDSVGLEDLPGNHIGGVRLMPSAELLLMFQQKLAIEDYWKISGEQYARTASIWLENFYNNRQEILPMLEKVYGRKMAWTWFQRWRLYLIALSEQFVQNRGQDWIIAQYLYQKKTGS